MESSCRDLFNDMTELRPILKNDQNTYYARFGFTPKTGIAFPKMGVFTVSLRAYNDLFCGSIFEFVIFD